jgi:hypothetical protein
MAAASRYAGVMRYPDGGGLTAAGRVLQADICGYGSLSGRLVTMLQYRRMRQSTR